jgi:hypothetical protein
LPSASARRPAEQPGSMSRVLRSDAEARHRHPAIKLKLAVE